jgi:hypothetical protein
MVLMGVVSFLVSANATPGRSGAADPAAASARASRREMLFLDADNRTDDTYVFPAKFRVMGMALFL